MREGIERLCHVSSNDCAINVIVVTISDRFDHINKAFLCIPLIVEAFLRTTTYPINDIVQSIIDGS